MELPSISELQSLYNTGGNGVPTIAAGYWSSTDGTIVNAKGQFGLASIFRFASGKTEDGWKGTKFNVLCVAN